jgi:cytochrome P450
MLRPQFVREQISDLDLEERHMRNMMRVLDLHIGKARGWTDTVDLLPIFFNLTLDSATEFLFGESVNSQLDNLPGMERSKHSDIDFAYAFNRSQMHLAKAAKMGDFWWVGHTKDFKDMCKQVHTYIDHFVQLALAQDPSEKEKGDKYVFLQALAKETRDPYELRSQLLNILLAGRDTTASLLGWLFMFLGQKEHAGILAKLRTVIIESFGTYEQPKDISYRSLKACTYLQWCLNESLRLYPVVPMNSRRAFVDTTLPRGGGPDGTAPICVEKGQEVMYSVSVFGNNSIDLRNHFLIGNRELGLRYAPSKRVVGRGCRYF